MGSGKEFQKDGRIDREVASYSERPECSEGANGSEVGRACSKQAKECRDAESGIESVSTTENITSEAPENGPSKKSYVLGQTQKRRS